MMKGLRNAGQSLVGRIVVAVLFALLILSFAVWGIGDIFRGGYGVNTVAKVGSTEITLDTVRNAYQTELQRLIRQARRSITPQEARALGLDTQVMSRLVTEAALDEMAKREGLAVPDQTVIDSVVNDPTFRGPNGQFSRDNFLALIRENGFTEAGFLQAQKSAVTRLHVAEAIAGSVAPPVAMLEPLVRYGSERRTVEYIVLPASAAGEIAAPDDAALRAFYEARRSAYRAPEYRKVNLLVLNAGAVTRPDAVSDADARAAYEQQKDSRFTAPEKRTIQIVVFPTMDEAQAASVRIKAGETLEAVAGERGVTDLGSVAKADIFDGAVADGAFGLAQGEVSAPIAGRFGATIARVNGIEAARTRPYDEVAAEIRAQIAGERARASLNELHDKVDDQRLSAKPLAEIAPTVGLTAGTIEAIDRSGFDRTSNPVADIPERQAVLNAIFNSDIGLDNEAVRLPDGGYVWFEIAGIEPARERTFDEVKAQVVEQWREDEITRRLAETGRTIVSALDGGATMADIAAQNGVTVQNATDLGRNSTGDLGAGAVAQIFGTAPGKAGAAARGSDRVVFRVTGVTVPPLSRTTQAVTQLETTLRTAISDDLLAQYVLTLQGKFGATVNQEALRNATTGAGT